MEQIYLTPQKEATAELVEKKSKFIGSVCHVANEQIALEYIKRIKKKYYDANHNAYAYITENTLPNAPSWTVSRMLLSISPGPAIERLSLAI